MNRLKYKSNWARTDYGRNVAVYLLRNARRRAKEKNLVFNLTREDVVVPEFCPVLGTKIVINSYHKDGRTNWNNSPSLDRVDPQKGYVKGNVRVISMRANRIKCDATIDELRRVYEYARDNQLH